MTALQRDNAKSLTLLALITLLVVFTAHTAMYWTEVRNMKERRMTGTRALKAGDYECAVRDLEYVVQHNPRANAVVRHLLGVAYIKRGEQMISAISPNNHYYQRDLLGARYRSSSESAANQGANRAGKPRNDASSGNGKSD